MVEVLHPAAEGATGDAAMMRDGVSEVTLRGRAMRDAEPSTAGPFPLVVVSHGRPGTHFPTAHVAENPASRGHVAASVDQPDST